jgi:regulator of protease activity HflC (stomatin/prohibitin superfamily)
MGKLIAAGVVVLALLLGLSGCWYTVPQGEEAIVLNWGQAVSEEGPGLHVKNPISESVVYIDTRQQRMVWDKPLNCYSADQQQANIDLVVLWHVQPDKAMDILNRFHDVEGLEAKAVSPISAGEFKDSFGAFTAAKAVTDRATLATEAAKRIQVALGGTPAIIDSVQIANIQFTPEYEHAVEQKVQREQELQREAVSNQIAINKQAADAQMRVTQANADRDAAKAKADGDAYSRTTQATADSQAIRARGDAEAQAIKARGEALNQNPDLVKLTTAERWDGKLPTTMVPGGATPFVQVQP